jgi:hypothetical protein
MAIFYSPTTVTITDDIGDRPPIVLPIGASLEDVEQAAAAYHPASSPNPNWSGFLAELLQSEMFGAAQIGANQILQAELPMATGVRQQRLLRASTALVSLPAVLLAAASPGGDPNLFMGAWLILRQADLVSPEVAAGMTQLATAFYLPGDMIRSLGATAQPP